MEELSVLFPQFSTYKKDRNKQQRQSWKSLSLKCNTEADEVSWFFYKLFWRRRCRRVKRSVEHSQTAALLIAHKGYGRFFKSLRDFLYSQPDIGNRIELHERKDRMTTGNFEVTVKATGQVLHSKKAGTGGKCNTEKERLDLVDKIQDILSDMMD